MIFIPWQFIAGVLFVCLLILFVGSTIEALRLGRNPIKNFFDVRFIICASTTATPGVTHDSI